MQNDDDDFFGGSSDGDPFGGAGKNVFEAFMRGMNKGAGRGDLLF